MYTDFPAVNLAVAYIMSLGNSVYINLSRWLAHCLYNLRIGIGDGNPRRQGSGGIQAVAYQEAEGIGQRHYQRAPSRAGGPQDLQTNHPSMERNRPHAGLTHKRRVFMNRKGQEVMDEETRWLPGKVLGQRVGFREIPCPSRLGVQRKLRDTRNRSIIIISLEEFHSWSL